jgi:hypothetical protein
MTVMENEKQKQQPPATINTLQQEIDEITNTIAGLHNLYQSRRRVIMRRISKLRQLASDLNVDDIQLRNMISGSFAKTGVSESWLRKILPESLKYTKHTRKDYLKRKQLRDKEPIIQKQQQQQEVVVELPVTRQPVLEHQQQEQQSSGGKATEVTTFGNRLGEISQNAGKEEEEKLKLKQRIEELEKKNRYLQEIIGTQRQQQQQEEEEKTFTTVAMLHTLGQAVPIRVTVNVQTKSIESMEIARDIIESH